MKPFPKARQISSYEAPALHKVVEELSQKAGIKKPVIGFFENTAELGTARSFIYDHLAGATHTLFGDQAIMLGSKFREIFGHTTPGAPVSEEMRAVLAHEIGHLKYRDHDMLEFLRTAPAVGMIAGLAGVAVYQEIHRQAEKARRAGTPEAQIHAGMRQAWEQSDHAQVPVPPSPVHEHAVQLAKTIAGGLLGLTAGVTISMLCRHHMEFRADRTSAELLSDGKPLARALTMLREGGEKNLQADPALDKFNRYKPVAKLLARLTHPGDAIRVEKLNGWGR